MNTYIRGLITKVRQRICDGTEGPRKSGYKVQQDLEELDMDT